MVLRPFTPDDRDALHTILGEPHILRYFPQTEAPSLQRVAGMIAFQLAHWEEHGLGWWGVEMVGQPRLIGWCGLQFLPETKEVEVAYLLSRAYWRRGLATEAALASLEFGFVDCGLGYIIALVHPDNVASQRVIKKLGMSFVDRSAYFGMELLRYRVTRSAYPRLASDQLASTQV
jgi:ribosomal-protein-alanine N-acetyltransferase